MKRKDKEIVRKPDIVITTVTNIIESIRTNSKQYIIALVVLILAIAAGFAYSLHARNQDYKVQYQLSQAMQSFGEFTESGKKADLDKAAGLFNEIAQKKRGESRYIAELYLAKINYAQGKVEEAKKLYAEVAKGTSSPTLKTLSQKAIVHIDGK